MTRAWSGFRGIATPIRFSGFRRFCHKLYPHFICNSRSGTTVRWRAPTAARICSTHALEERGVCSRLREPCLRKPPGTNLWLRLSRESATPSNRMGALSSVLHVWRNAWQPPPKASLHQRIWLTIASILGDRVDFAGAPGWIAQVPFRWPVNSRTTRGSRRGSGGQLTSAIIDLLAAAAATNDCVLQDTRGHTRDRSQFRLSNLATLIGKFKLRRVGRSSPAVAAIGKAKSVHDARLLGEDGTRGTRVEVIAAGVVRGRVVARRLGVFGVAFIARSPIVTGLDQLRLSAPLQLRQPRLRLAPVDGPTALRLEAMQAPPQVALQAFNAHPAINRPRLRERVVKALLEHAPGGVGEPLAERRAVQLSTRVVVRGVEAPCKATIHKLGMQTAVARDAERP
eukprot:scaffold46716_cov72-Phaeocystis_antarctica.AAC.7